MVKMLKVRCVWVDGPTVHGFVPGMVFEAQESVAIRRFYIGKLLYAKRKDKSKLSYSEMQCLPTNGSVWKWEFVE